MAATVTLRVLTGAARATVSTAITGFAFLSSDAYDNSSSNMNANPITIGNLSYEKAIAACIDASPANKVENFQAWSDGTFDTGTCVLIGSCADSLETNINTTSGVALTDLSGNQTGCTFLWDSGSYATLNSCITNLLVFQMDTNSSTGSPGNWTQETISWSYDEQ
jgi:hypothetical protein